MKKFWLLLATFFRVGFLPFAPGSWTSLITAAILFLVYSRLQPALPVQILAALAVFLIGIPAATKTESQLAVKDPRPVVIDEVAGQMIALLGITPDIRLFLLGFVFFRIFDILKPWPVCVADRKIPGGLGIMFDDVLAGLYSLGALHLVLLVWHPF